ncbi:MAG TPA: AAA family ATPase [Armatimonadota bacterium]|nr:AAA family ATPase [Armatimonadota bacterium]
MSSMEQRAAAFHQDVARLRAEVQKVIVGQRELVEDALTCVLAGGHGLLEGLPGLGKTMLVRTLADALSLHFARIQFTPDLMPSDITGTNILIESPSGEKEFRYQPDQIFANIVLADEINRHPEDAVRDAGGDAGALGDGGGHRARAAGAVLRARHAEPHRAGGHLPAAGSAA